MCSRLADRKIFREAEIMTAIAATADDPVVSAPGPIQWARHPNRLAPAGLDPVFLLGNGHALRMPAWYPAARMEAHLAHTLLRNPHDLTSHARRILFWQAQPGCAGLAAALNDLAYVLEGRCSPLWRRLRQRVLAELPASRYPVDQGMPDFFDPGFTLFGQDPAIRNPDAD
jgi:hypothetical protein